jgi:hypothetical protein
MVVAMAYGNAAARRKLSLHCAKKASMKNPYTG